MFLRITSLDSTITGVFLQDHSKTIIIVLSLIIIILLSSLILSIRKYRKVKSQQKTEIGSDTTESNSGNQTSLKELESNKTDISGLKKKIESEISEKNNEKTHPDSGKISDISNNTLEKLIKQNLEQEKLNQELVAKTIEADQRSFKTELHLKELEGLKTLAEENYQQIYDSINYSKYIQDSMFPTEEELNKHFKEHFIYYKPKETIGGDFYYLKKVRDTLIVAVADCTGHGVPGALLTMLSITMLDNIVMKKFVDEPGIALEILRDQIKKTFRSYGTDIENKNGLDIALCAININTKELAYSGAFNPLLLFRKDELLEYKATRVPISYYPVEKEFESIFIQLEENDVIYLFSDGYQDQLGGENEKKFSKRNFYKLLHEIHKNSMSEQKEHLEKRMDKWIGSHPQVDDITVMGIKF